MNDRQKRNEIIEFVNNASAEKIDIAYRMLTGMIKASRK